MINSQFFELSFDEYVDKSMYPSSVFRLASADSDPPNENLWMIVSREPKLLVLPVVFEISEPKRTNRHLRARLIAIFPEQLRLNRPALVDCTESPQEFSFEEVKAVLVSEPERILGNLREETMGRIAKVMSESK